MKRPETVEEDGKADYVNLMSPFSDSQVWKKIRTPLKADSYAEIFNKVRITK